MNRNKAEQLRAEYLAGLIKRAGASIANTVRTASGHFTHWYRRQNAVRQLQTLDNRTLQDIGVCRGDIYAVADETHSGIGKKHY